jgi:hypothetical protein
VEAVANGGEVEGTTPPMVAHRLKELSDASLEKLKELDAGGNNELQATLTDIRAMALLGGYYSQKIAGATELALHRRTGEESHRKRAVEELTKAADTWHQYSALAASLYKHPIWMNRVGIVDWQELNAEVLRDIEIARGASE